MPYTLSWSPADQNQIDGEFRALLNDPTVGGDAAQLALYLKRVAQHTHSTPPGPSALRRCVYPAGGRCAAFYAYESNNGTRIFVVGFCLEIDSARFAPTAQARLTNVP